MADGWSEMAVSAVIVLRTPTANNEQLRQLWLTMVCGFTLRSSLPGWQVTRWIPLFGKRPEAPIRQDRLRRLLRMPSGRN